MQVYIHIFIYIYILVAQHVSCHIEAHKFVNGQTSKVAAARTGTDTTEAVERRSLLL